MKSKMKLLKIDEIKNALAKLPGWQKVDNTIIKEYELKDFTKTIAFVVAIGSVSEKMDHHPDILIHSWNKVKITLSTHSKGGITPMDIELAGIIENLN